ncbi:hypothetical protein RFI_01012 [Reticulomyxa filosa]|uniref:Uncharacterized protein n=1 Tax=Reticulomyxa filosa TaxID=46433 RepID=X6PD68_RETFI|nr:hypothetical protein RFI_01012 [Reticulomyxa filosa]|eukprot:ETO36053.1 hypothetical protein RFI_01012 [Reticulomyxa filosa]
MMEFFAVITTRKHKGSSKSVNERGKSLLQRMYLAYTIAIHLQTLLCSFFNRMFITKMKKKSEYLYKRNYKLILNLDTPNCNIVNTKKDIICSYIGSIIDVVFILLQPQPMRKKTSKNAVYETKQKKEVYYKKGAILEKKVLQYYMQARTFFLKIEIQRSLPPQTMPKENLQNLEGLNGFTRSSKEQVLSVKVIKSNPAGISTDIEQ